MFFEIYIVIGVYYLSDCNFSYRLFPLKKQRGRKKCTPYGIKHPVNIRVIKCLFECLYVGVFLSVCELHWKSVGEVMHFLLSKIECRCYIFCLCLCFNRWFFFCPEKNAKQTNNKNLVLWSLMYEKLYLQGKKFSLKKSYLKKCYNLPFTILKVINKEWLILISYVIPEWDRGGRIGKQTQWHTESGFHGSIAVSAASAARPGGLWAGTPALRTVGGHWTVW